MSFSLALNVQAGSVQPPVDAQGHALATVDFVGALPCIINGANTTSLSGAPLICGASSTTVTRSVVYGVIASSIQAGGYLVFRDTVPAAGGSAIGVQSSTVAIIYNYDVVVASFPYAVAGSHFIKFPVPLQFQKGIAVNPDTTMGGSFASWTILYRPISATE